MFLLVPVLNRPYILLSLLMGFSIIASHASAGYEPAHRFSGFATLGLVTSDDPELAFRRDITQEDGSYNSSIEWKTDTLIGLQWQGRWSATFDATVQLVAKERHENTLANSIEWAFMRYRSVDGVDLRVGRLGSDFFMLSEYRQVGYAFQWVRPPQDFYGPLALYHFDGADIAKRFDLNDGTLNLKMFYGNSNEKYPGSDRTNPGVNVNFSITGIGLNLELNDWKWRYTYSDVRFKNNIADPLTDALLASIAWWPEAGAMAHDINTDGKSITYQELSAAYDNNIWWAQAEAAILSSDTSLGPNGRNFYFSIGRKFGALSVFGLRGYARPDKDAPTFTAPTGYPSPIAELLATLANAATVGLSGVNNKQDSIGVGARWDFRPRLALTLQVDKFNIDESGTNLWVRTGYVQFNENRDSTVISLAMDVLF